MANRYSRVLVLLYVLFCGACGYVLTDPEGVAQAQGYDPTIEPLCPDEWPIGEGTGTPGPDNTSWEWWRDCQHCFGTPEAAEWDPFAPLPTATNPFILPTATKEPVDEFRHTCWEHEFVEYDPEQREYHIPLDDIALAGKMLYGVELRIYPGYRVRPTSPEGYLHLEQYHGEDAEGNPVLEDGLPLWTSDLTDLGENVAGGGNHWCYTNGPYRDLLCTVPVSAPGVVYRHGNIIVDFPADKVPYISIWATGEARTAFMSIQYRFYLHDGLPSPTSEECGITVHDPGTPVPTVVPSPTPSVERFWLGEPIRFNKSYDSESSSVACTSAGDYSWGVGGGVLRWSYNLPNIPGVLVGLVLKTGSVNDFKRMGANEGCGVYTEFWPNTSDHLTLENSSYCMVKSSHAGVLAGDICEAVRSEAGVLSYGEVSTLKWGPFAAGSNISMPFTSQWRKYGTYDVTMYPIYYSVPIYPTATPAPSPTATALPLPTPRPAVDLHKCEVIEWATEPLGDFGWDGDLVSEEAECFTLVPGFHVAIPELPLGIGGGQEIDWDPVGLCIYWVKMPSLSLLGIKISVDWFLVPVLAWFVRRLLAL